jgi:hypothetical protein
MNKKLLLLFLLVITLIIPAYSQDNDTLDTDTDWKNWDNPADNNWENAGANFLDIKLKGAPAIELNYGVSKMNLKNINDKFASPGMLELKLGSIIDKSYNGSDIVTKYKFNFIHIGNFSTDLSGNQKSSDLITNSWRFGIGWASGFGYDLGNGFEIIPYHQNSLDWTIVNMQSTPSNPADIITTDLFNKTLRFGNSFQGGIQLKFINNIGIDVAYERSIIYSRHLVWKWGGSELIEATGQWLIDKFVEDILDSTPNAVPIVNFLLKNALSYGIYELRQEKMNWPFETAAPLVINQFKLGINFMF